MINKPKGTQDIYSKAWLYRFIENNFVYTASNFGYNEIMTPIFEEAKLFKLSIGSDTDIVKKELYQFEDKANRELALRPEGTAPIVRAFVENKMYVENSSAKFFYIGSMFRYERPQRGRKREFRQLGIEQIGIVNEFTVVESILLAKQFLSSIGINNYKITINNLGLKKDREKYKEELKNYFKTKLENLCSDCQVRFKSNPLRLLDCKIDKTTKNVPNISSFISNESKKEYEEIKKLLNNANIKFVEDQNLVRGLDYYSNTVYEFVPLQEEGSQSTILAGGQYFDLVSNMGGPNIKGVGFASGIERLINIIEPRVQKPNIPNSVFVISEKDNATTAFKIINKLRSADIFSEFDPNFSSIKKQFKKVSKLRFKWAIICENETLTLKNQKTSENYTGTIEDIIKYIEEKE